MGYIISLIALLAAYIALIFVMPKFRHVKVVNAVLLAIPLACYLFSLIHIYRSVGFSDWNFQNALPFANVSPFMFGSLAVYPFLPRKAKQYWALLIALLSVGMFFSAVLGCVSRAAIHYKFHFSFLLDYIAHMSLSLFGVYQVRANQTTLAKKDCLWSGAAIVFVAVLMFLINAVFGTAFFGLATNETYSIYNMVLVPYWWLSDLLYFVGLTGVLFLSYFYLLMFAKIQRRKS